MTLSNLDKKALKEGFTIKIADRTVIRKPNTRLPDFYAKTGDDMASYLNDWSGRQFLAIFMELEEEYNIQT